eukprot:1289639-Rhodomonas_salina.2
MDRSSADVRGVKHDGVGAYNSGGPGFNSHLSLSLFLSIYARGSPSSTLTRRMIIILPGQNLVGRGFLTTASGRQIFTIPCEDTPKIREVFDAYCAGQVAMSSAICPPKCGTEKSPCPLLTTRMWYALPPTAMLCLVQYLRMSYAPPGTDGACAVLSRSTSGRWMASTFRSSRGTAISSARA